MTTRRIRPSEWRPRGPTSFFAISIDYHWCATPSRTFEMPKSAMIEVHHLRKEYGGTVALQNLHLEIPEGEVFGLIGPNGAGKTTLIRILATLLEPTYGTARIDGIDVVERPLDVHPIIGYMSDFFSLY